MAGILDEVMDAIAAKEKQGETPTATPTHTTPPATPPTQEQPPAGDKSMHAYSDQFKDKYGEKKK